MNLTKFKGLLAGDRRPMLAVAGGLLLAVIAVAAYVLFFSGGGADPLAGPVAVPGEGQVHTQLGGPATIDPVALAGTRDPFNAAGIAVPTVAAAAATTPAAPTPSASASPSATGIPFVFKLLDLSPTTATVLVNGHSYTPKVGAAFATYFRLYAIFGSNCAGFQYQAQNLALCKGDSTVLTP